MFWRRFLLPSLQWRDPDEEIYDVGWHRYPPKIKFSTFSVIGGTVTLVGIFLLFTIFGITSQYGLMQGLMASLLCISVIFLFLGFWLLLLGALELYR